MTNALTWQRLQWQRAEFLRFDAELQACRLRDWRKYRDMVARRLEAYRQDNIDPKLVDKAQTALTVWAQMVAWGERNCQEQREMFSEAN